MKRNNIWLIVFLLAAAVIFAEEKAEPETPGRTKHRLEIKFMWEYLVPNDIYKTWKSLYLHYYGLPSTTFNYFLHLGTVFREEKNDHIGIIGGSRDWSSRFYTYTALVAGTECSYLPKFRFDNDLNFKLGKKRNVVWTLGINYINYFSAARDVILSSGITLYLPKWIGEYRIYRNHSSPGGYVSYTHLFSMGYGVEKKTWTYITVSSGSQAYLALYVLMPEEIKQSALNISFKHRQWLSRDFGLFIDLNYVGLKEGYDKYGVFWGFFLEM